MLTETPVSRTTGLTTREVGQVASIANLCIPVVNLDVLEANVMSVTFLQRKSPHPHPRPTTRWRLHCRLGLVFGTAGLRPTCSLSPTSNIVFPFESLG